MKKHFLTVAISAFALTGIVDGQTPAPTVAAPAAAQTNSGVSANRVVGEVTGIDLAEKAITLKADGGSSQVIVLINDATVYYRAKPDALARAGTAAITPADMLKATLAEVGMNDRVVVLGKLATDQKSIPARVLIIATKADIAQKHELDREQWRRRGILGTVTAVNTDTKEITLATTSREGTKPVIVAAGDAKVQFRRYAPDSVKFADAKMSSFADLKVGDRLRALGERAPDGARFMPEEIVSGSFRQIVGTVVSVDPAKNEIKLLGQDKKPLTIVVNNDSNLRRLPPMMAQFMAQRAAGGGGAPGGGNNNNGQGRPEGAGRPPQAPGGEPGAGGGMMGGGQRRMGGGGGGFDPQDMLERMPQTTLAELKPGEMVIVSSTAGADPTRLTAVVLVAGVDAIVNAAPAGRGAGRPNAGGGQDLGVPGGIDIGIGLP